MAKIITLPENTKGRDFVIGDVHGAFEMLDEALEIVGFDPKVDRLISVGDLIDRGPDSTKCLEYLKQPWFHAIRGNHEDLFLKACEGGSFDQKKAKYDIVNNGMGWVLDENKSTLKKMQKAFKKLPIALEIEQSNSEPIVFVHADIPKDMDWQTFADKLRASDEDVIETAIWDIDRYEEKDSHGVEGVSRVFVGHTPMENGVEQLGNVYFLDTGAVFKLLEYEDCENCALTISDIHADSSDFSRVPDYQINVISIERLEKPARQATKK